MSEPVVGIIQRHVAAAFSLAPRELVSQRRSKAVSEARHLAMWLVTEMTPLSKVRIGRSFGGRDHSSVIHALEKAEILLDRRPELVATMLQVRAAVEAEIAAGDQVAEAVMLTETVVVALRVALLEMARRNPARALSVILPLAQRLAGVEAAPANEAQP